MSSRLQNLNIMKQTSEVEKKGSRRLYIFVQNPAVVERGGGGRNNASRPTNTTNPFPT